MLRNLYDWVISKAETTHAKFFLFLLAFAESSFFPIPPDVLLIAMVIANRQKWLVYFSICLLGSVLGGLAGYAIGMGFWDVTQGWFFAHIFSEDVFAKVQQLYVEHDFWIIFVAAFTPIPYKVFTITAGVVDLAIVPFVLASVVGRGGRFIIVAGLLRLFGAPIKSFIEKYFNILSFVFAALLIGGFVLIKYVLH